MYIPIYTLLPHVECTIMTVVINIPFYYNYFPLFFVAYTCTQAHSKTSSGPPLQCLHFISYAVELVYSGQI